VIIEVRRLRQLGSRRLRPLNVAQIDGRIERRAAVRVRDVRIGAALEQHRRKLVMAVDDGDQQRARIVGARLIDVGAAVEQRARGIELALPRREQERRHATRRAALGLRRCRRRQRGIGAPGEQQPHDVGVTFSRRPHQRGLPAELLRVRVGAAVEQQFHGLGIARVRRQHQHGLAFARQDGVRVLAGVEQPRDDGGVTVAGREVERLGTGAVRHFEIGTRIQEGVRHL
jgi:hypothetical protein